MPSAFYANRSHQKVLLLILQEGETQGWLSFPEGGLSLPPPSPQLRHKIDRILFSSLGE